MSPEAMVGTITIIGYDQGMDSSEHGSRVTTQGAAVLDELRKSNGFLSAQDVWATLRASGNKIGLSTVYRRLQAMADDGLLDVVRVSDGEATYRYCGPSLDGRHHHHVVCRSCGRAEEVDSKAVERWATSVATGLGFVDVEHTVELFGVCAACSMS